MKKIILGVVGMIMLLLMQSNFGSIFSTANKKNTTSMNVGDSVTTEILTGDTKNERFTSKASIIIESKSGEMLEGKNQEMRLPIASMVKIMTALCVMEEIDGGRLSTAEKVVVSQNASGMGGSQMFLDANSEYCVGDLLKGVIVVSANDACVALAERISGSVDGFVAKMNAKAELLGMTNTRFINCTGLPGEGQYSSAKDVAAMSRIMMTNPMFQQYSKIWLENYTHPSGRVTAFTNTNKLIRFYKDCVGGKTGFTNEAMFCLSALASRNGLSVISVVIGSSSSKDRFGESVYQLNKAFGEYENKAIIKSGDKVDRKLSVKKGKVKEIEVEYNGNLEYFTKKNSPKKIEVAIDMSDGIKAPIQKGDVVGTATLMIDGVKVSECKIVSTQTVEKATLKDKFNELISKMKK